MKYNQFFEDYARIVTEQKEIRNEALKRLFKDKIKISFLFKVLHTLNKKYDLYNLISNSYSPSCHTIFGYDSIDLTICHHICGVHSFNTLFLKEQDRVKLHNSQKYIDSLCKTVYNQISFYNFDEQHVKKLMCNEDYGFMYYPPIYSLYILSLKLTDFINKIINNLNEKNDERKEIEIQLISSIISNSNLIFIILQNGFYENIYPLLRQNIETFVIFLTLKYSKTDLKQYKKFQNYKIKYDSNFEFEKEFVDLYESSTMRCSIQEYLNYGWIDEVIESYYLNDKNKYTIKFLIKLVNLLIKKEKNINDYCKNLYSYYQKSHYFTHSKLFNRKFDILTIMDISQALHIILLGISKEVNFTDENDNPNIIDYCNTTINNFQKLIAESKKIDLEKYYKERGIKYQ